MLLKWCVYINIYIYTYAHIYLFIYIFREREKGRKRGIKLPFFTKPHYSVQGGGTFKNAQLPTLNS